MEVLTETIADHKAVGDFSPLKENVQEAILGLQVETFRKL